MTRWALPEVLTRETGLTRDQLRGMCRRGLLRRGVHWAVIDRKTLYCVEEVMAWLDSRASEQRAEASRSGGRSVAGNTPAGWPSSPPRQLYRMRLGSAVN